MNLIARKQVLTDNSEVWYVILTEYGKFLTELPAIGEEDCFKLMDKLKECIEEHSVETVDLVN